MQFIYTVFGVPLGWIMWACYQATHHYVLSLFLFTLITRLIMIPFTISQQKTSVKTAMMKPQMDELNKKYANNREKLNEEMMALYKKEGYNPTSGCLPLLIQFPILFGLIDVIYKPMKHILRLPDDIIQAGIDIVKAASTTLTSRQDMTIQLSVIKEVKLNPAAFESLGQDAVNAINGLNLHWLGMDLSLQPTMEMFKNIFSDFNPLIFIPIFAGITSLLTSLVTTKNTSGSMEGAAGASMKSMMLTMPILSTVISFSVPAGVGIYWTFSNVIAMVQSMIMNKIYNPKEMAEKARIAMEEKREQERQERIEARKNKKLSGDVDEKVLPQKELNRKRLAEARRREAEKYGEVYVEIED